MFLFVPFVSLLGFFFISHFFMIKIPTTEQILSNKNDDSLKGLSVKEFCVHKNGLKEKDCADICILTVDFFPLTFFLCPDMVANVRNDSCLYGQLTIYFFTLVTCCVE